VVRSFNAGTNGNGCRIHNSGWGLPAGYYGETNPTTNAALSTSITPTAMGHPRDICHAVSDDGVCPDGRVGDGVWDRDAYFRTNYRRSDGTRWTGGTGTGSWQVNTGLPANATRYQVYVWEIANRGTVVDDVTVLASTPPGASGATKVAKGAAFCSPALADGGPGTVPGPSTPDRRLINVAVVNCEDEGVNGNSTAVQTVGWLEAFLVEPSIARARNGRGDVYVEVVGASTTGVQLVSKKVPYLIE
ncbi:MAG: pilus assembly protein TadG-related protein, partial [Sphingomicrobium sp.]